MSEQYPESRPRPRISLDGPSALAVYRDRADLVHAHVADVETESDLDFKDIEDYWVSDEDVAAKLADTKVFGRSGWELSLTPAEGGSAFPSGSDGKALTLPPLVRSRTQHLRSSALSREIKHVPFDELGIRPPSEDSPLHLLVGNRASRRKVKNVRNHLCTARIPTGAFYRLGDSVYVPTPEMTFLLMASRLSLVGLVMLGMELCGHYRLVGTNTIEPLTSNRTLFGVEALTTPDKLAAFIEDARDYAGVKHARQACRFIAPDSASPMESAVFLLLCLPRAYGGYGMRWPTLNARRVVTQRAESFTLSSTLVPDLYWSDGRFDIEYDSEAFHSDPQSLELGARRALALRAMHVEVMSLTRDIVYDAAAFETAARMAMRAIGQRFVVANQNALAKREMLRSALLYGQGLYR